MSTKAQMLRHFAEDGTRRLDTGRRLAWASATLFMVLVAVLVGTTIANAQWLYLGLAVAVCLAVVWPVEAALGFYAFLLPFQSIAVLGQAERGTTANWVLGAVAAVALLGAGSLRGRLSWPSRNATWLLLFSLWALISCAWALDPQVSIARLPTAAALILLYFAGCCWRATPREVSVLNWAIAAGGAAASCLAIRAFMSGVTYMNQYGATSRASLVAGSREADPNMFAADLLLPLALTIALYFSSSGWRRKLAAVLCTGLIGYATFLTMSRGALLAVMVVLGVYAVRLHLNRKVLGLVAGLLTLLVAMPTMFFSRLQEAVPTGGAGRLDIWRAGLVVFKHYFLLGAGLANFPVAYYNFAGSAGRFVGYNRGSHNIYLDAAVEMGIVGIALLCIALLAQVRVLNKFRAASRTFPMTMVALEASTYAMLLTAMFLNVLWSKSFWLLWMVLAMSLRAYSVENCSPPGRQRAWLN